MSNLTITDESFAFNKDEVRVLASIKYWALRYASSLSTLPNRQSLKNIFRDSGDVVDQSSYRGLKREWCDEWKRLTCQLLELDDVVPEDCLKKAIESLGISKTKAAALSVEVATWEPFHELAKGETRFQKLRTDEEDFKNYCSYTSKLPMLKPHGNLKAMHQDFKQCIGAIVKGINGANFTWVWVGLGALALLLVAPFAAGLIGGAMGLSGVAATSAGLAFLGGGSLAAGGMGMTGGYVVLMAGGALLGYGGGSKQQKDKFAKTSKEEILVNCAKLHAMRHDIKAPKSEICKQIQAMQIDLDRIADELFCNNQAIKGKKQSAKAIVLATYRRILRGELTV